MDKFGRSNKGSNNACYDSQIVIPNDFLRLDGTNKMQGDLDLSEFHIHNIKDLNGVADTPIKVNSGFDLNGQEIVNPKIPESDNALASMKTVTLNREALEPLFDKSDTNIFPVVGQRASCSSYYVPWGSRAEPKNAFDGSTESQWVVGKGGQRSWIKIELPSAKQIWKISLLPRRGHQQTTQYFTHYWVEASNNDVKYDKILESTDPITHKRTFEFPVTKPYKYFRLEGDGKSSFGLTEFQMFEATVVTKTYVNDLVDHFKHLFDNRVKEYLDPLGYIPASRDLQMTFIPTIKTVNFDTNNIVTSITDPITNTVLSNATPSERPTLRLDSTLDMYYLDFNGSYLSNEISISLGGQRGDTMSFFLIANTYTVKQQNQFSWKSSNSTDRLDILLPWSNGKVIINYGKSGPTAQLFQDFAGRFDEIINKLVIWTYVRNGSSAKLYLNGVLEETVDGLTSHFHPYDTGRFTIGTGELNSFAKMGFYGLLIYKRALSDDEIEKMNKFLLKKYKIE